MLDNIELKECVRLEEYEIRELNNNELRRILGFDADITLSPTEDEQLITYSKYPWAYLEKEISDKSANDPVMKSLVSYELRFAHAGIKTWLPFIELIRTLNLLQPSEGPVITRHFYHIPFANRQSTSKIEKIIYDEPTINIYDDERGTVIQPLLYGYKVDGNLTAGFSGLRSLLTSCLSEENSIGNTHIRIAIHNFENADRRFEACPLEGSFNAIDPLMSYEAALESLVVLEEESGVEDKLALRIASLFSDRVKEVENFVRKVFWLRSKMAHGARPIEEIERLIVRRPNDAIDDKARKKQIPLGPYDKLLIDCSIFPGFLVNLREITRLAIRFFCDEFNQGRTKKETIHYLDNI